MKSKLSSACKQNFSPIRSRKDKRNFVQALELRTKSNRQQDQTQIYSKVQARMQIAAAKYQIDSLLIQKLHESLARLHQTQDELTRQISSNQTQLRSLQIEISRSQYLSQVLSKQLDGARAESLDTKQRESSELVQLNQQERSLRQQLEERRIKATVAQKQAKEVGPIEKLRQARELQQLVYRESMAKLDAICSGKREKENVK